MLLDVRVVEDETCLFAVSLVCLSCVEVNKRDLVGEIGVRALVIVVVVVDPAVFGAGLGLAVNVVGFEIGALFLIFVKISFLFSKAKKK